MGRKREVWESDDGVLHDSEEAMVEHEAHLEARDRAARYVAASGAADGRAATRAANTIIGYEQWRRRGEPEKVASEAAE